MGHMYETLKRYDRSTVIGLLVAVLVLAAIGGIVVDCQLRKARVERQIAAFSSDLRRLTTVEQSAIDAYNEGVRRFNDGEIDYDAFADIVEEQALPRWDEYDQVVGEMEVPDEDEGDRYVWRLQRQIEYGEARRQQYETYVEAFRTQDPHLFEVADRHSQTAQRIIDEVSSRRMLDAILETIVLDRP